MDLNKVIPVAPNNCGWLDIRLNEKEMDYVWRCIKNKKEKFNYTLAGNITSSYTLMDMGDWFWMNVLKPLSSVYGEKFSNLGKKIPTNTKHPYKLDNWWVNYQKQHEFNPLHNHKGIYSFVIWMKIPKDIGFKKQKNIKISSHSNSPLPGVFEFLYIDIRGNPRTHTYELEPEDEGRMLFFPSQLSHAVYPFFNCDEERISVSGNIILDTSKQL